MRFLFFLAILIVCVSAAGKEYSGMGGWKDEHAGIYGKVWYHYKYDRGWVGGDSNWGNKFTLTLKFKNHSIWFLPNQTMTVSGWMDFNDPHDPFAGGGIVTYDGYNTTPLGWLYCEQEKQDRRICTMLFWGFKGVSDEPDGWFEVRKTFKGGTLCYLSGEVRAHYLADEDYVVWHSKRLCD